MGAELIDSFSKRKDIDHFENDTQPLQGRKHKGELLREVNITITRQIEGRTVGVINKIQWERDKDVYGTLQGYSQKVGTMSSDGHRQFLEKVFVTEKQYQMQTGNRIRIKGSVWTVFNVDAESDAGFVLHYIKEIKGVD